MEMREVDIHGMMEIEAKKYLERYIVDLPKGTHELRVIHGYKSGQALKNMVRSKLRSKRIIRVRASINPGESVIDIK
jgi:DNA-nicking Smr family endonuclease